MSTSSIKHKVRGWRTTEQHSPPLRRKMMSPQRERVLISPQRERVLLLLPRMRTGGTVDRFSNSPLNEPFVRATQPFHCSVTRVPLAFSWARQASHRPHRPLRWPHVLSSNLPASTDASAGHAGNVKEREIRRIKTRPSEMDRIAATQIVRSSKLIAVEESEKIAIALKSMHENEHTQQRLSVGLHTLVKQTVSLSTKRFALGRNASSGCAGVDVAIAAFASQRMGAVAPRPRRPQNGLFVVAHEARCLRRACVHAPTISHSTHTFLPRFSVSQKGDMHVKKGARKFKTQRAYCDPDVGEAKSGMTPLHFATLMGRNDIVAVLVNEGNANASQKDTEREVAPIIVACEKGVLSIIRFLIEEARVSFDFTEYIERGISPVHLARDNGHGKCSRYLEYLQSQELSDMAERTHRVRFNFNLWGLEGQFDFVRSSARTPRRGVRADELTKSRKIPTRKILLPTIITILFS